jgi:hypothetical protein
MMRCTNIVLAHTWKSSTALVKASLSRYKCPILHSHGAFISSRNRPLRNIGFTPIPIVRAKITTLSAKNSIAYNDGDRVHFDVDGSRYEGSIQGKNGGWYTIEVRNEQGGTLTVKKRASQINLISTNASELTQQSSDHSKETDVTDCKFSIREASSIPELIDQTLDSTTIMNIDLLLSCGETKEDSIKNKKEQEYLDQCEYFSKTKRWVTFTDLHVAPNTLRTCLNVLSTVHAEAKRQDAGVSFIRS